MEKAGIDLLITKRPKVYGWLGFQKFLLWLFLILGILLFLNTCGIVASGLVKYFFIEEASQEIAKKYRANQVEVMQILIKYFNPIKYKTILYSFFLSLSFFILSRYCQKILNRNRYILQLEGRFKKVDSWV